MYVCSWMWMWKGMAPSKAPPNIPKTGLVYHALTAEKGGAEGSPSPLIAPRGTGIGFSTEISKAYVLCRTDQPHSDRQTGYGYAALVWIGPAEVIILRPQSSWHAAGARRVGAHTVAGEWVCGCAMSHARPRPNSLAVSSRHDATGRAAG